MQYSAALWVTDWVSVLKVDARLSEHKLQISFELIEREPIARLNSLGATDINANLGASEFMVKNIIFYRMPSVKLVLNSLVLCCTYNFIGFFMVRGPYIDLFSKLGQFT